MHNEVGATVTLTLSHRFCILRTALALANVKTYTWDCRLVHKRILSCMKHLFMHRFSEFYQSNVKLSGTFLISTSNSMFNTEQTLHSNQ